MLMGGVVLCDYSDQIRDDEVTLQVGGGRGETRNAYRVLVGSVERRTAWNIDGIDGRIILKLIW